MSAWVYPDGWEEGSEPGDSVPDYGKDPYRVPESPEEIGRFLRRVFTAIRNDSFHVLIADTNGSRSKNLGFMNLYGLWGREQQKELLLSIDASEFCHIKRTEDGRDLYVFCLKRTLYKAAVGPREVWVYIKHDFPESEKRDVVISMHELELPILLPYAD